MKEDERERKQRAQPLSHKVDHPMVDGFYCLLHAELGFNSGYVSHCCGAVHLVDGHDVRQLSGQSKGSRRLLGNTTITTKPNSMRKKHQLGEGIAVSTVD
jgi:hypothetical protein